MKKILRITTLLAIVLMAASCEKTELPVTPDNNGGNGGGGGNPITETTKRVVVYAVGDNESRLTLSSDDEWEALLEQFCHYAETGNTVTFYNIETHHTKATESKESPSITTADREELKRWMKAMEKEGRTVRVTYDTEGGTWHGEAYATAPANNTQGVLIGTWRFNCMVVTHYDQNGQLLNSDLYAPEENSGTWYYTFADDGTLTVTIQGMDGTIGTDQSSWSLSDDGVLSSDLLPNGIHWNVNWISPYTMIITHADLGTAEGDFYYQLQFEAVTSIE